MSRGTARDTSTPDGQACHRRWREHRKARISDRSSGHHRAQKAPAMHTEKSFAPPFYGNQNVVTGYSIPDFDPGYFIQPEVLTAAECDALLEHFAGMPRGRAGTRHLMRHPEVAALANSECLLALARRALGNHATPFRATLFNKSAAANWLVAWHQDTALPLTSRFEEPGWGPWSE